MTDTDTIDLSNVRALLQQGRFGDAEVEANKLLKDAPDHRDILYILAVSQRYQNRLDEALKSLNLLKSVDATYGRAWQEDGHVLKALGTVEPAKEAYHKAVQFNPGLLASWQGLAEMANLAGDTQTEAYASGHLKRLSELPRELVSVTSFIAEGQLYKAEQLCRSFLQNNPHHIEAMRLLAQVGLKLHVLDDAEFLLESVLEFQPDHLLARLDYVEVLNRRQKYDRALEEAETVLNADPNNPSLRIMHANALMGAGDLHYRPEQQ